MQEIWKTILDYPNYQVSNMGRVKSLERREVCGGRAKIRIRREKILKPSYDKDGYHRVVLCKNSKIYHHMVHRLVLGAFDEARKPFVNHKNGNKQDNQLPNLEWCSSSENAIHSYNLGLSHSGEKHYKAKLSHNDVTEIKTSNLSLTKLAQKFNVDICTISDIVHGRTWKRHTL